ncbi:MAG TPA: tRNA pseudouridine(55) synthase TruB [Candidatus Omnitrophota bacterium]|nr:tRNA pseudouridine(55) synthase TruB [Candidatus Omnitrophota bacterium]
MIIGPGSQNDLDISGILVVDKDKAMTSHDVVDLVRKRFKIRKVGHAGTLDPDATGVLVLLLGAATRLSSQLSGEDKKYRAKIRLGERTDSGDSSGKIISEKAVSQDIAGIKRVMESFVGEIDQVPPMFSAKKVKGKRLYKLARQGKTVERLPVKVTVKSLDIISVDLPEIEFEVLCTKGTYIRQLADDIGEKAGSGGHLVELRRLSSGNFKIENAVTISEILRMNREELNENLARI